MPAILSIFTSEKKNWILKDDNIVVGGIHWKTFYIKTVLLLWKYNIVCWLLLSDMLESINGW